MQGPRSFGRQTRNVQKSLVLVSRLSSYFTKETIHLGKQESSAPDPQYIPREVPQIAHSTVPYTCPQAWPAMALFSWVHRRWRV